MNIQLQQLLLLALGTLASEDLTCITAGQLVQQNRLHWLIAVLGCFAGIYLGDLALFVLGRLSGQNVIRMPWLARRISRDRMDRLSVWYEQWAIYAIFAARFLPGTRLPLYLAAGALGRGAGRFALWAMIAALIWTPLLVLLIASFGDMATESVQAFLGKGWISFLAALLLAWATLRLISLSLTRIGRAKLIARVSLLWRWEFWPMWLFYAPMVPYIAWLSIRHRGFATITAANPGIPHGGFVGESKFQILSHLQGEHVIPSAIIGPAPHQDREARLIALIAGYGWTFPLILKPDVGQRGAGVKLVDSTDAALDYIRSYSGAVVVQPFHPGPYEAGIFYFRHPCEPAGQILSITDKHFSEVTGDGIATLEELIWLHPRYRMQAERFLKRHETESRRVLRAGERFRLAMAGNHCQGTMFCDGAHLITPQLTRAIDRIAKRFNGFYFGRFDVRYGDLDRFKAGEDLAVIELNGVTSESTNIYEPTGSLRIAYLTLTKQWSLLFAIAQANQRRGAPVSSFMQLTRETISHYTSSRAPSLAD